MNPFRLFLAAALSSMAVYGNESAYVGRDETRALEGGKNSDDGEDDDELTPVLPEYGQRQCFEPTGIEGITKRKDYENFKKYKRDVKNWPTIKKYVKRKKVKDYRSPIDDPKEMSDKTYEAFREKYLCGTVCENKGDRCVKVYPTSGKTDKPTFQCLQPCYKKCSQRWLRCGGFLEDPPSYPIAWWNAMNQQCWQVEQSQTTGSYFMRTTCSCPSRDYSVSNGCDDTYATASLSNCIQGYLSQGSEINFQNVKDVQFGIVKTTAEDVDFQGTIQRSMFCKIDSAQDVEFGGGNITCAATFKNNVVFDLEMADDTQFEEGTTVNSNIIFKLQANDDFKFQEDIGGAYTTTITNNYFREVTVAQECKFDPLFVIADLDIASNYCSNFNEVVGSVCSSSSYPIQAGFSCIIT